MGAGLYGLGHMSLLTAVLAENFIDHVTKPMMWGYSPWAILLFFLEIYFCGGYVGRQVSERNEQKTSQKLNFLSEA